MDVSEGIVLILTLPLYAHLSLSLYTPLVCNVNVNTASITLWMLVIMSQNCYSVIMWLVPVNVNCW